MSGRIALALSGLALIIALSGNAVAGPIAQIARQLTGKDVKNSSLTGADIKNSSLTGSDVRNNRLTGSDIKNLSLGDFTKSVRNSICTSGNGRCAGGAGATGARQARRPGRSSRPSRERAGAAGAAGADATGLTMGTMTITSGVTRYTPLGGAGPSGGSVVPVPGITPNRPLDDQGLRDAGRRARRNGDSHDRRSGRWRRHRGHVHRDDHERAVRQPGRSAVTRTFERRRQARVERPRRQPHPVVVVDVRGRVEPMRKIQSQGVHHITIVGADRQTSIDFWEGVLGMPFVFEQPNLDNASESHLYFDPGDGRLITIFTDEQRTPDPDRAPTDPGCVHHLAFALSQATFAQTVERLDERGIEHSGVKDRGFMDSIYFSDPLGLLIELASYRFEPPAGHTHAERADGGSPDPRRARRRQHRGDPPGRRDRGARRTLAGLALGRPVAEVRVPLSAVGSRRARRHAA